jgi:AcrR family transcriptional regulator
MNQMVQDNGPRAKLLDAATVHLRRRGLGDLSLRQLAAAIGTSHRMLIYHFGSFEGLLVAVVEEAEAAERERFRALTLEGDLDRAGLLRVMWRHLTDPELAGQERLFFELYGQALQGRRGTEGFLDRVVATWLDEAERFAPGLGVSPESARQQARLDLAVTRGLLLDLLTTGDRDGVDAAFERYVATTELPRRPGTRARA